MTEATPESVDLPATKQQRPPRVDVASYMRLTELADYIVPFCLRVICDIRLADHLAAGPQSTSELAARTHTSEEPLRRVLRAVASKGIFAEREDGSWELTPLAQPLRSNHPFSIVECFPLMPPDIESWARMDWSIRTGEPTFPNRFGTGYYAYMSAPERSYEAERFELSSESVNPFVLRTVLPVLQWDSMKTLVDLGGGYGSFACGILRRFPEMSARVVDQAHIAAHARDLMAPRFPDVIDRCAFEAGDLFDTVLPGADCYLLKTILHDWPDPAALHILQRVRDAMRDDSQLTIIESVKRSEADDEVGTVMDVKAMVLFGGHARTEEQFDELFEKAGLRRLRTVQTPTMAVLTVEKTHS